MIKPFGLGMQSQGRSLNAWHHTDYGNMYKLQYFWDQIVKKLSYLALADSWGEVGRRRTAPFQPPLVAPEAPPPADLIP